MQPVHNQNSIPFVPTVSTHPLGASASLPGAPEPDVSLPSLKTPSLDSERGSPSPATLERAHAELSRFLALRELVLKRQLLAFEISPASPVTQKVLRVKIEKMTKDAEDSNFKGAHQAAAVLLEAYAKHAQRRLQQVTWAIELLSTEQADKVFAQLKAKNDELKLPAHLSRLYAPSIEKLGSALPAEKKAEFDTLGTEITKLSKSYAEYYMHLIFHFYSSKSEPSSALATSESDTSAFYIELFSLMTQFNPELGFRFMGFAIPPLRAAIQKANQLNSDMITITSNLEYKLGPLIEEAKQKFHVPRPNAFQIEIATGCSPLTAKHAELFATKVDLIRWMIREPRLDVRDASQQEPKDILIRSELRRILIAHLRQLAQVAPEDTEALITFRVAPKEDAPVMAEEAARLGISTSALRRRIDRALTILSRAAELKNVASAFNFDVTHGPPPSV